MKKGRKKRNRSTPTHSDTNKKSKQPTDNVTADTHSDSENWTDINDDVTDVTDQLKGPELFSTEIRAAFDCIVSFLKILLFLNNGFLFLNKQFGSRSGLTIGRA